MIGAGEYNVNGGDVSDRTMHLGVSAWRFTLNLPTDIFTSIVITFSTHVEPA